MDDCISRQAAINLAYWHGESFTVDNPYPDGVEAVDVDDIENLPSVEPERKKGKWTVTPIYIKCSECGESFMLIPQNFCPNCGAKMEEGEQE